jgi:Ser/Thr protein kinase RdoA (MazF antagonist)
MAELLIGDYGIVPSRLQPLGSFWNTTYRIDSDAGESFVLRIATPSVKNPVSTENEIHWLNYVRTNSDLIVPEAIATLEGNWVTRLKVGNDDRICCLFSWIEGESARTLFYENTLQHIGRIVGTLHNLAQHFDPPASMNRPAEICHSDEAEIQRVRNPEWLDWLKTNPEISTRDIRILSSAIEIVLSELKTPKDGKAKSGLVHGDLHLGNFIVTSDHVAIIDFDQLGWGYFSVELAWLLSTTADILPLPESGRREACLTSYHRVNELPFSSEQELREFEVRIAFFHLLFFDWLHSLSDREVRSEHIKTIRARINVLSDFVSKQRSLQLGEIEKIRQE